MRQNKNRRVYRRIDVELMFSYLLSKIVNTTRLKTISPEKVTVTNKPRNTENIGYKPPPSLSLSLKINFCLGRGKPTEFQLSLTAEVIWLLDRTGNSFLMSSFRYLISKLFSSKKYLQLISSFSLLSMLIHPMKISEIVFSHPQSIDFTKKNYWYNYQKFL